MILKPNFNPTAYNHLHPLSRGLVALYPFWEGHGDKLEDTTLNKNHGDLVNGTKWTGSQLGFALDFDGVNDNVLVTDSPSIQNIFDGGGSISAWINPRSDGGGDLGRIVDKRANGPNGWMFFVSSQAAGVSIEYFSDRAGDGRWKTTVQLTLNKWTHVAVVYNSDGDTNTPSIYFDGISQSITETGNPTGARTSDVGNDLFIGNVASGSNTFDGLITDVRIYNRALSTEEAKQLFYDPYSIYEI